MRSRIWGGDVICFNFIFGYCLVNVVRIFDFRGVVLYEICLIDFKLKFCDFLVLFIRVFIMGGIDGMCVMLYFWMVVKVVLVLNIFKMIIDIF